jgi:hypothetical protein
MRTIERSEFLNEDGGVSLEKRVQATLRHGLRWYGEIQAQQAVTQRLSGVLGADFVLISNLSLPGINEPFPLILIGPQGVRLILTSALRGVYRAKGTEWMTFDSGRRRFKRVRPNLQHICGGKAETLLKYLNSAGFPLPEVEAVLIFIDPRTHVDTAGPRVRIVLSDAIEHFSANMMQLPPIMDHEDISGVVDALLYPRGAEGEPRPEEPAGPVRPVAVPGAGPAPEPVSSLRATLGSQFVDVPQEQPADEFDWRAAGQKIVDRASEAQAAALQAEQDWERRVAPKISTAGGRLARRLPRFSRNQWILLAVMVFFEFIILATMVFLVVSDILRY